MVRFNSPDWDSTADVVVVGSGTGLVGALTAATEGRDTLVLEKSPKIGGTTAVSGGVLWVPNTKQAVEAGYERPLEDLTTYVQNVAGDHVPETHIRSFLEHGPEVIEFIEDETALEFQFGVHSDYHPEWEGGGEGAWVEPKLYDGTRLGDALSDVRESPYFPFPVTHIEMMEKGGLAVYPVEADYEMIAERMEARKIAAGRALIAGLYEACLDNGVRFETDAAATELVVEDDRVVGLEATVDGSETLIGTESVLISAGGFEWDEELRDNFLRGPVPAAASPPYNTGDGIRMGMDLGAKVGNMNEAWWFPVVNVPDEEWEDGSDFYHLTTAVRTLPHSIMVNTAGDRFVDETTNYHDITKSFFHFDPKAYEYPNIPAYAVFDDQFRSTYHVLGVLPEDPDPSWLQSRDSLGELAEAVGIDSDGLEETVASFNEHAREGEDPDFGRGGGSGGAEVTHPDLGTVAEPPFYAVEILPGAIGTKGGIVTSTDGEVLDVWDDPIPGLYASGNSSSHVMGMGYAGGGATLGPNVVFAHLAAEHAANQS